MLNEKHTIESKKVIGGTVIRGHIFTELRTSDGTYANFRSSDTSVYNRINSINDFFTEMVKFNKSTESEINEYNRFFLENAKHKTPIFTDKLNLFLFGCSLLFFVAALSIGVYADKADKKSEQLKHQLDSVKAAEINFNK
jgi:hypothetical protein